MKKSNLIILSVVFSFLLSSYELPKNISEDGRKIIHKGLIWSYGYSVNNVYMVNYDWENSYSENGEKRYDLMIYKLDYMDFKFVPASEPFDYVVDSKYSKKSEPNAMKMVKIEENKFMGGTGSVKILNDGFLLLTYKTYNKNNKPDHNNIVLFKYVDGYWDIVRKLKFKTSDAFRIDQYYYNPQTNERKYMVHNNDVIIKFTKFGNTYKHVFDKGENIRF